MEHNNNPFAATISLGISIFSSIFAFISLANLQSFMAITGSLVAMISGGFAIRYYWYATKKVKNKK